MIEELVKEELPKLCAGCDVPVADEQARYAQNGKPYCPRCYEEVTALYGGEKND